MADPLFKVRATPDLDNKTKNSLFVKLKNVTDAVQKVEAASGLNYPPYYVEPSLVVVDPGDHNYGGDMGVLYARTIPVQTEGRVSIIVQITAPLVLYGAKSTVKTVLAHELLHYVQLIRNFLTMNLTSDISSSSIFEERYVDMSRAISPSIIFRDKRFANTLSKRVGTGVDDGRLAEKCKSKWIESGRPIKKISLGGNRSIISAEAIMRSNFDPKVKEMLLLLDGQGKRMKSHAAN